uniref:Uncharacterized protein n=1 Tax=Salix viminalis TaxID=40686 RepID=A0A6N2N9Q9_SALVM
MVLVLAHFMTSMAKRIREVGFTFVVFLWFSTAANGLLSPKGINYEASNMKKNGSLFFLTMASIFQFKLNGNKKLLYMILMGFL